MLKYFLLTLVFLFRFNTAAAALNLDYENELQELDQNVYFQIAPHSQDQIIASINLKNLETELLGLAFDLVFDPTIIEYQQYLGGNFLEGGGEPIYLVSLDKKIPSRLIIGASLKRTDRLQKGSGVLLKIIFSVKQSGKTALLFENTNAYTLKNEQKSLIKDIQWRPVEISIKDQSSQKTIFSDLQNLFKKIKISPTIISVLLLFATIPIYLIFRKKPAK